MAATKLFLEGVGDISIVRRRGLKYISIRVDHSGVIRLNLPWYVPKATGLIFATQKKDWIMQQLSKKIIRAEGHEISGIKLKIEASPNTRSKWIVADRSLILRIPGSYSQTKKKETTNKLLANYLKYKTEEVIVPKANSLARLHKLNPASITVKKLRSRWGSCDHGKNIKLSLYLYSLPEELWNYVLCHELAHLEQLNHSRQFWNTVESMYPNYKSARKSLKDHAPGVYLF